MHLFIEKNFEYCNISSKVTVQGHWTFIKIPALGTLSAGYTKNYAPPAQT